MPRLHKEGISTCGNGARGGQAYVKSEISFSEDRMQAVRNPTFHSCQQRWCDGGMEVGLTTYYDQLDIRLHNRYCVIKNATRSLISCSLYSSA